MFFSEEKNQETFNSSAASEIRDLAGMLVLGSAVSSEKKIFLA
jgi:hypothetical protein